MNTVERERAKALQEFQSIPGVGIRIAQDLYELGYHSLDDLRGEDPEVMYENLCELQKAKVDRCMLYVFRCAVYFVSHETHEPELLKWWKWKERKNNE